MKNVLVTGGAGFVGSHFVRALLADRLPGIAGAHVTVLDKLTAGGNFANLDEVAHSKRLDFIPGDVADQPLVAAAARRHDAIVHFAAENSAATNVLGTEILLDAARAYDIQRFLQVSTAEVYGPIDKGAWTERSALTPHSPYAATKAGADLLALAYHRAHGVPVVIVRASATYGPNQHPAHTIPRLTTAFLSGVPAVAPAADIRDWLHVDDHVQALALALVDGRPGEIYHAAGTTELPDRDLAALILHETRAPAGLLLPPPASPELRYAVDDDKIRRDLGWRPRKEFDGGLAATIQWYRENEPWWRPLLNP